MNDFIFNSQLEFNGINPAGSKVHVRIRQRTARKSITIIEGLDKYMTNEEMIKMLKKMRRKFSCGGALLKSEDLGPIIKLSGDNRMNIKKFLVTKYEILEPGDLIIHGF